MLKLYNVNLIHKADGTSALSGSNEDMQAFQESYKQMRWRYLRYKRLSYTVLAVCIIAYTIFFLR